MTVDYADGAGNFPLNFPRHMYAGREAAWDPKGGASVIMNEVSAAPETFTPPRKRPGLGSG